MAHNASGKQEVTVRPALRYGLLLILPVVLILLPRVVFAGSLPARLLWAGLLLVALLVPLLTRLMRITTGPEGVQILLRGHASRLTWDDLVSASVTDAGGSGRNCSLVLEGAGGQHLEMPLTLIRRADRRRLLTALESQASPGTVRRDAAMEAMLAEPNGA